MVNDDVAPRPDAAPRKDASSPFDRRALTWTAVGLLLVVAANAVLLLPFDVVEELVAEDGIVEWVGALGLFAAAGCFLASFIVVRRRGAAASGLSTLGMWVLLLLAVVMFAAGGEEISWGQRIFGWSTPESLVEHNVQGETNLHNLTPFESSSWLSSAYAFTALWLALFVGIPLLALIPRLGGWLRRTVPVLPWGMTVVFLLAVAFQQLDDPLFGARYDDHGGRVGDLFDHSILLGHAATEIWESAVEVLTGVAAFWTLRRQRRHPSPSSGPADGEPLPVAVPAR